MTESHAAAEEEPASPPWLPALGLALFAAAGIAWSLCARPADSAASAGSEAASATASAAPAAKPH